MRDSGGLDQGGGRGHEGGKSCLDSGYILKVEPLGFVGGAYAGVQERGREPRFAAKVLA